MKFKWARIGDGYECSSQGDQRFSAFFAKMSDGRTIEQHYQCDVKGFEPGGTNWKLGKGKLPVNGKTKDQLWKEYYDLWVEWSQNNKGMMTILEKEARKKNCLLTDCFAHSKINQARALAEILTVNYNSRRIFKEN